MKIPPEVWSTFITFIVGGGLATLVSQAWKALGSLKQGARASTRAIISDMADARQDAEDRAERQTDLADFWRAIAANYGYQLRAHGIVPDPENPIPPRVQVAEDQHVRREVDELEDTLSKMKIPRRRRPPQAGK